MKAKKIIFLMLFFTALLIASPTASKTPSYPAPQLKINITERYLHLLFPPNNQTAISEYLIKDDHKFKYHNDVLKEYTEYQKTFYKTGAEELQHRVDVLKQQYILNYALFGIVLLLVAGGFILAWKQFDFDMKHREQLDPAEQAPTSEVEIGPGGLKINSSIIGLIILLMSFAFFSLYITEVFPIKVISSKAPTTNSTK